MDSDKLRRACERAGLKEEPPLGPSLPAMWRHGGWEWREDNPALPSYLASLLVAMVHNRSIGYCLALDRIVRNATGEDGPYPVFATDEQRIRAAMEVLGDEV